MKMNSIVRMFIVLKEQNQEDWTSEFVEVKWQDERNLCIVEKCFVWVSEMETFWEMTGREVKEDEKDHEEIVVFCFCFVLIELS